MGTTTCLAALQTSDWIQIAFGIVAIIGYITRYLAKSALAKFQKQKDVLTDELKEIKQQYEEWLHIVCKGNMTHRSVIKGFKLLSARIEDLMKHVSPTFNIPPDSLDAYRIKLVYMVLEGYDFQAQYPTGIYRPGEVTRDTIVQFQQDHRCVFTNLTLKIHKTHKGSQVLLSAWSRLRAMVFRTKQQA